MVHKFIADRYGAAKAQFPGEGRRKLQLRVLQDFWISPESQQLDASANDSTVEDNDPFDEILDGPEVGILIRTDYSNEAAWQAFLIRLQHAEKELADAMEKNNTEPSNVSQPSEDANHRDAEEDSDEEEDSIPSPLIKVLNPQLEQERAMLRNISNLLALRLFNNVDVRPSPPPPAGTKRMSPPNRLVDQGGWQEVYEGHTIWVYDALSNSDQCVRLVSQAGDFYGTATGDSWRARVTHVCELQFNMTYLGMKIDFGGLDRWDFAERQRNMEEAEHLIP